MYEVWRISDVIYLSLSGFYVPFWFLFINQLYFRHTFSYKTNMHAIKLVSNCKKCITCDLHLPAKCFLFLSLVFKQRRGHDRLVCDRLCLMNAGQVQLNKLFLLCKTVLLGSFMYLLLTPYQNVSSVIFSGRDELRKDSTIRWMIVCIYLCTINSALCC